MRIEKRLKIIVSSVLIVKAILLTLFKESKNTTIYSLEVNIMNHIYP